MKKISIIVLTFILSCFMLIDETEAKEKTLNQLEAEAKANRDAYNKAKNQKELNEQERAAAIKQKETVQQEIKNINAQLKQIEQEVVNLQKSIDKKDKEIKEIMKFVQVSNGESAYLEYAFGASSFTDFIYRVSVAEQLSNYNDELISSYNKDIKTLEQKQKDLAVKQSELNKKQQELSVLEARLSKEIETLKEGMLTKDREYRTTIDLIKSLKSMGCSGNDTKTQCLNKQKPSGGGSIGGVQIPSTNGTYMPIARGRVTSDYGSRSGDYHTGIDFSNSKYGDNVYSVASGKVILVQSPGTYTDGGKNCGNWIIYVLHNINGHAYVTSYWHLSSPSVSKGQMVTANTVVGKMGGLHSVDACSFGVHVHLNLFDGNTWDLGRPNSGRINPRRIMPQIPKQGVYFTR